MARTDADEVSNGNTSNSNTSNGNASDGNASNGKVTRIDKDKERTRARISKGEDERGQGGADMRQEEKSGRGCSWHSGLASCYSWESHRNVEGTMGPWLPPIFSPGSQQSQA